ncbi:hypothetical protein PRIPAC_97684 [Pristionchus pacificus]|uniref:SCP domain-containing protein n=1 Tax=Pristionchus pacificus TaxID=54126 RepID=A0A2A6BCA2_PRIPA|nr:hypothetical protein PRIPAC_97684 [Pristionchus pacificus]|eukprot:PDM63513.1 hypothetical protein PRIPAC_53870 [Pristionchus pacificus]
MLRLCIALAVLTAVSWAQSCGIPSSEASAFLAAHNKLRAAISSGSYVAKGKRMPAAKTPIAPMTWDCAIEKSAQAVANTCVFAHSQNRQNLGENLYTMWSSNKMTFTGMGKKASDSWENEFQQFGWPDVKLTPAGFSSGIGHATQMAWAKSTKLGCGMKLCDGDKKVLVVCQYRDAMNLISVVCLLLVASFTVAENLPDKFFGSFKLDRSEKFDEYLEEKGYGFITRKLVALAGVTKVITKAGPDTFNFDNLTTKKDLKYKNIKLGEEFIGEGLDGSDHKITFTFKNGVFYEKHVPTDNDAEQKEDEYRFHMEEDELVQTLEYNTIVAKRFFKRQ